MPVHRKVRSRRRKKSRHDSSQYHIQHADEKYEVRELERVRIRYAYVLALLSLGALLAALIAEGLVLGNCDQTRVQQMNGYFGQVAFLLGGFVGSAMTYFYTHK